MGQYSEVMTVPTESDLYAPRVRLCYTAGSLGGPTPPLAESSFFNVSDAWTGQEITLASHQVDGVSAPEGTLWYYQIWDTATETMLAVTTKVVPDTDGSARAFFVGYGDEAVGFP